MSDPNSAATNRAPAVSRAFSILRLLGRSEAPLGVNQIARDLDLVPSTCLHVLRALVDEGIVVVDPESKRYGIGVGILPIARNAIQRNTVATLAEPRLLALSSEFGVTAIATQLIQDRDMVVVALSMARQPFRLSTELGSKFPALTSATGRCVAAFGNADARSLRKRFQALKWDNAPDFDTWMAQVAQTRQAGYGEDRGEYIGGVTILAAPVFDQMGAVAQSLVAIGLSEQMTAVVRSDVAKALLAVRDEIVGVLDG